ncbi:Eco57I restriction-modification methylase domain-containing protein [Ramlibacter tataouinensis]|uniref:site-specific DNA-methyltransferase (adenine-specific) n=1 Tax=Ramlibacter tataouinensis (strain ATCC BAA-407 / DSM 14655 / LMG 21543 / TTB310) TaxID=365046 RepID=F5Y1K2_RAMTT|nr:Eco57I restriction-modification methylase domain-containing protein [Ramlibacter tataouinensis]AEG91064.1 restriction-modification system, predicted endonuclease-like protein [Ramlibacter tataouinensis TTB310]
MSGKASFSLRGRNPDVLTCIANLSNDEVFTPPEFASRMLDTLAEAWAADHDGASIWANSSVRFLDPCTKSGVFLREITTRLTKGLTAEIPNLEDRVNHILTKQVFGIGITYLTTLLARRSVYCSKHAQGKHSIAKGFDSDDGNIWFERTEHTWASGRCSYCGANQGSYDRGVDLETHAYAFIHTNGIQARIAKIFGGNMQFDVIVGNPPYQLGSDGGTRDVPIYQRFVEQAKMLQPRYLTMVIPSRWMASGLGLGEFRHTMLNDRRMRELVDYPAANDVFPGVEIKAGVSYFLWDAAYGGNCRVTTIRGGEVVGPVLRKLGEYDVFVRDARAVSILHKVLDRGESSINTILARDKEFGWTSNFDGFHETERPGDVPLYFIRKMKRGVGYIGRKAVTKSAHLIDKWKVLVPEAFNGGDAVPHQILGKPLIAPSPSVCTQSFLFFYVGSRNAAKSLQSYYATRFFRFLVSLRKITQHATHSTYAWVPLQTWNRTWTDEELYAKYGITRKEQAYIESQVRAMNLEGDGDE